MLRKECVWNVGMTREGVGSMHEEAFLLLREKAVLRSQVNNQSQVKSAFMFQKHVILISASILLGACATPQNTLLVEDELARLDTKIGGLEISLAERFESVCSNNLAQIERDLSTRLKVDLTKKLAEAEKAASRVKRDLKDLRAQCNTETLDDKLLLGAVEDVTFIDEEITLEARIDSGAETSSVGVYALTQFERDGKGWVRYKLVNLKKAPWLEHRIRDDVRIKSRVEGFTDERYEIRMDIKVGSKVYRRQVFNLANRKNFDYQALLGRSFLRDVAIVDVSVEHQLKRKRSGK